MGQEFLSQNIKRMLKLSYIDSVKTIKKAVFRNVFRVTIDVTSLGY